MEDEVGAATERFQSEIGAAGFVVRRAHSVGEAREQLRALAADGSLLDLLVLDRKLPYEPGSRASEAVGDRLFEELDVEYPDTPIVVLTGFSDEDFALLVLQRRNILDLGSPSQFQRVTHFRKRDADRFRLVLQSIGSALQRTEAVELENGPKERAPQRVLKRVGQFFDGAVVRTRPAVGGASDSAVWLCDVLAQDGRPLTEVVVKIGQHDEMRPSGGFMGSVPSGNAAQPMYLIAGACGGLSGHVAPLAAHGAESLADLLSHDADGAVESVRLVVELLDKVPSSSVNLSLLDFCACLIEWPVAEEIAAIYAISLPSPDLSVMTHLGCVHGDLHPGNVLLDDNRPVFIDFDRQRSGPLIIDSVSLALGAYFNKSGPLRGQPLAAGAVEACVSGESVESTWVGACTSSWGARAYWSRERWAALLAYALRQLKYPDNQKDAQLTGLAIEVAHMASRELTSS